MPASLLAWDHKRRTRVAAARDTFGNGLLGWFARTTLDTVLVERRPTKGQDPLEPLKALLVEGRSLVLYPEGTRGEPGDLVPFKRGIGLLAMAFPEIPIYAIYIRGVERCLGRKEVLLVPFQVRLMADHTPLCGGDFPPLPGEGERERSARIALALENRLRALGGLGPREDALEGINPS